MTDRSPSWTIDMGAGVTFVIDPVRRHIETRYPDGHCAHAERPDTDDNRREAADQGYTKDEAVWVSLRDHEVLHTLISRALLGRESPVLRHEAGAEPCRYALRLHEEALTISTQRWLNTRCVDPVLAPHLPALPVIEAEFRRLIDPPLLQAA